MENNFQYRRHEKNINDVIEKRLKEKDWRKSKKYSNIEVFQIEENEARNQTNREHKRNWEVKNVVGLNKGLVGGSLRIASSVFTPLVLL